VLGAGNRTQIRHLNLFNPSLGTNLQIAFGLHFSSQEIVTSSDMATVELPEPFASIPREVLTFGPSPIQHLPRISQALGGKVNVYAKREDCNSGLAYGGNKTRKLE